MPYLLSAFAAVVYVVATVGLADGTAVRLACSWRLSAGQDAVIAADFYGTGGGAALRNVGGSFYDFTAELFHGTSRTTLAGPPLAAPDLSPHAELPEHVSSWRPRRTSD